MIKCLENVMKQALEEKGISASTSLKLYPLATYFQKVYNSLLELND